MVGLALATADQVPSAIGFIGRRYDGCSDTLVVGKGYRAEILDSYDQEKSSSFVRNPEKAGQPFQQKLGCAYLRCPRVSVPQS